MLKYRYLDHMTDAIIEAYGETLQEAFANAAEGLVNMMFEIDLDKDTKTGKKSLFDVNVTQSVVAQGYDLQSLLYDWLEKILLIIYIDKRIPLKFDFVIFNTEIDFFIEASVQTDRIDLEKYPYKLEVKSITYHEMEIKKIDDKRFLLRYLVDL